MPHVAEWFDTSNLTPQTLFEQEQTTYVSFTQYGNGISFYVPGSPNTGSLANAELKLDKSGGTTILVWPRSLTASQQKQVFAYANAHGWAILRGGEVGPISTAEPVRPAEGRLAVLHGGYTPDPERKGRPVLLRPAQDRGVERRHRRPVRGELEEHRHRRAAGRELQRLRHAQRASA